MRFEACRPPTQSEYFKMLQTIFEKIDAIKAVHVNGGLQFLNHTKTILAKIEFQDWTPLSASMVKSRIEVKINLFIF